MLQVMGLYMLNHCCKAEMGEGHIQRSNVLVYALSGGSRVESWRGEAKRVSFNEKLFKTLSLQVKVMTHTQL